ncbi:MAG TPA: hypothetical protein VJB63_03795 [Patescibacteria group bacterium]|nr:hypothetical protein [Patescibacteria group bacterium]
MSFISNKRFLNNIIILSLIGILIISLKNYAFSKNTDTIKITSFYPSPTLSNRELTDPYVPCINRYMSFDTKNTWRYKITTFFHDDNQDKQSSEFFTTKIIQTTPSSFLFESRYDAKKETVKTLVQCKKSGIYGSPFPIFMTTDVNLMNAIDYAQFNQSIRLFPPNKELKKGETWQTTINLDHLLSPPIPLSPVLYNTVINNQVNSFSYRTNVPTTQIRTDVVFSDEMLKNLNDMTDNLYTMSFAEGIGIINFNMNINIDEIGIYKTTVQLIDFN